MSFALLFGLTGAIVAYIVKGGQFLNILLQPSFGGSPFIYSLIFFFVLSYIVKRGLKLMKELVLVLVGLVLILTVVFLIFGHSSVNPANLSTIDIEQLFLPFGVIMFALLGTAAIPEMKIELKNQKNLLKTAIIWGSLIPIVVYIIFAYVVLGISGSNVSDGAIIGLKDALGYPFLVLGIIFGLLTISTSFISIGIALKETFMFDYKMKERISYICACYIPLALAFVIFFSNISHAFFKILDITGIISGGIVGFLVVPMIWKAKAKGKRKPEYTIKDNKLIELAIIIVSGTGMLFELLRILGIFG
jgi:tyrosine-specific transport protein